MKIPFIALILQGIPEQIAIVTFAFIIARSSLQWKKIISIGVILAFTSYIIRLFPVTFGIHTIIMIGLMFLMLIIIGDLNLNTSVIVSLISALLIIIIETICLSILMPLFGVTSELFFANTSIRILITLPQVLVMFLMSFLVFKIRIRKEVK